MPRTKLLSRVSTTLTLLATAVVTGDEVAVLPSVSVATAWSW